jgi:RNA polymerase sigma factor (sigma-70 family)
MANVMTSSLVRQIESLFDGGSVAGLTDRQLLERFVARRDHAAEDAFAALVTRHGPMVLGVCRQLLGDHQHAEDAFQAVFLVLARKARSIRDPDLLGNWLYGVALRTSRKAKVRRARRRKGEEGRAMRHPGPGSTVPADRSAIDREQAEALHEEIERLPSSFRLPLVLCYFEGLTPDEAARRLHCPAGTVHSRLVRARDKLRRSLTRRGVVLPAAALTVAQAPRSASASISSPLCDLTTRAALHFAAGHAVAPLATALAREVLRSMLLRKLRLTTLALLCLGAIASGAGYLTHALAMKDEPRKVAAAPQPRIDDAIPKPAPGRMFVSGRVLDPKGEPVPGAMIVAHTRSLALGRPPYFMRQVPIGDARADRSGRFRIDAPRTSSFNHAGFGVVALAPGHGVGWVQLDPDDDQPTVDIALRPEQVIHGRLFDVQGRPVPDVTLSVSSMSRDLPQAPAGARVRSEGVSYGPWNANDFPAWPKPVTTDPEGRFTLRGLGRDLHADLTIHDPRFALQTIEVETKGTSESKTMTAALAPSQIINVRVTYADTGKPVPHAPLRVMASRGRARIVDESQTDAEGRARVNSWVADRT